MNIKTPLIIIGAVTLLAGSLTIAVINEMNKDKSDYDFGVENIEDSKFPIADYLYVEHKEEPKIVPSTENIEKLLDINNTRKNPILDENGIIIGYEDVNMTKTQESNITTKDTKDTKPKSQESSNDLYNKIMDNVNPFDKKQEATQKYTDDIFKDTDKINKILTKRNQNQIISNTKASKPTISKEYGDDTFTNYTIKDLASNEHKLYRTLTAFKNIPATLTTAISSDVGGKVMAKVEEDIFAQMGKAILIPKGSQIVGFYQNNNKIGEFRLRVIWTRILTPQGINILLTEAQGADLSGANGLLGELDSKHWERYGIPLALTTLSNGLILTMNNQTQKLTANNNALNSYTNAQLMQNAQNDISQIMRTIIQEQVRIQPTIRIHAGSRILISSSKDIFFPVPTKNEVMARFFNEIKIEEPSQNDEEIEEIGE